MSRRIVIGSRESQLAVVQSMTLVDYLRIRHPELEVSLLTMKTTGDRILDKPLDQVGGKGLFVKELDLALRDKRADLTVHSLKDMPMELPKDLPLLCFSRREDPRDVLVLPEGQSELAPGAVIGTASLRRSIQLKRLFPGYLLRPVRGNLQTRLRKLDSGEFGALVLAAAGLKRLGLENRISRYFSIDELIPAAGQGILGVQGRSGEEHPYLEGFGCRDSMLAAFAERAFVRELNGGCTSPICAHALIEDGVMTLYGLYAEGQSNSCLRGRAEGPADQAEAMGRRLARELQEKWRSGYAR